MSIHPMLFVLLLIIIQPVSSYQTWLSFNIQQFQINPSCLNEWAIKLSCVDPKLSLMANMGNTATYISNSWRLEQVIKNKGQKYTVEWDEPIEDVTVWLAITGSDHMIPNTLNSECDMATELRMEMDKMELNYGYQVVNTHCLSLTIEFQQIDLKMKKDVIASETLASSSDTFAISDESIVYFIVIVIGCIAIVSLNCYCIYRKRTPKPAVVEDGQTTTTTTVMEPNLTKNTTTRNGILSFDESITDVNTSSFIRVFHDEEGVSICI